MNDQDFSKGMVRYTSRDYNSILEDFFAMIPKLTELWKPEASSDPGVVLGKYLASVADMLGVNLDWLATEVYAPSVSQRKDAEKIFHLIGYELGFYTAARTEVTVTNNFIEPITLDFGFNGANFSTLNAYTDIQGLPRTITYNILPGTSPYGNNETRSTRQITTDPTNVFADTDKVVLQPNESVTRIAIEGELRNYSISVADVKANKYKFTLPSQHVDTTAVWVRAIPNRTATTYVDTRWVQCDSPAEFSISPEPRFAVTYDNYSNAQIEISNYLNQLENYDNNWLVVYWIDTSGVIGCVGEDTLQNLYLAKGSQQFTDTGGDLLISNLSNTVELPHTHAVTGRSPETAKEAYRNSRDYINTFDSLVTLPDYGRFLNREPGVDCGVVLDCQKALEYNLSVYNDATLTKSQKSKKYITKYDFPEGEKIFDWGAILNLGFDPTDPNKFVFAANFKRFTVMCFAVHNDFKNSSYGNGKVDLVQVSQVPGFTKYKPPLMFIEGVKADFRPLQALSTEIEFGDLRVFPFNVVGMIYPNQSVSKDVADILIANAKEALALNLSPANRQVGVMPTVSEIVNIVENCDSRINHFDVGSPGTRNHGIVWNKCDPEYFNIISFAQYVDPGIGSKNIIVAPEYIV